MSSGSVRAVARSDECRGHRRLAEPAQGRRQRRGQPALGGLRRPGHPGELACRHRPGPARGGEPARRHRSGGPGRDHGARGGRPAGAQAVRGEGGRRCRDHLGGLPGDRRGRGPARGRAARVAARPADPGPGAQLPGLDPPRASAEPDLRPRHAGSRRDRLHLAFGRAGGGDPRLGAGPSRRVLALRVARQSGRSQRERPARRGRR